MITRRSLLAAFPAVAATTLPGELKFYPGSVNSVVIVRNGKTLIIYGDPADRISSADTVLLTHARRDLTWSAQKLCQAGAKAIIPAADANLFDNPKAAWQDIYSKSRLHDYSNQGTHFPTVSLPNTKKVQDKETLIWEGLSIQAIPTPGFTRQAVSYSFRLDGKLIIATGDLILASGKVLDLYSLQDGIPELKVRGYHGFASRIAQLIESLRKIDALNADLLIPARGPMIEHPRQAIQSLITKLQGLFANYLKTDAYRWYFGPENYRARAQRVLGGNEAAGLPFAETIRKELPSWMRAVSNSRLVISKSGEAILIDCGSQRIIDQVQAWKAQGLFKQLRAVYVTHYHDDHTDFAQAAADQFGAEVWSSAEQSEILMHPASFRMPCLTPNPIPGLKPWRHLETRDWHEFSLKNFHFPGQTLYHGALLVSPKESSGERVFFIGDSFTPSGVDDYCLLNRNLLKPNRGLISCIKILEQMPDALLVNQHVEPLFRFSPAQLKLLRSSLEERVSLIANLVPFDDANYGIDEQWMRLTPYVQKVRSGQTVELSAVILNHSAKRRDFHVSLHLPTGWSTPPPAKIGIATDREGSVNFSIHVPSQSTGLSVVTASVSSSGMNFQHWTEAIVEVI